MSRPVTAFLSYATASDRLMDDTISDLRDALEQSVRLHLGDDDFHLFQDKVSIKLGDRWEDSLRGALQEAHVFLPVLTPHFFKSEWCRKETEAFLDRLDGGGRTQVIPLYLVTDHAYEEGPLLHQDPLRVRLKALQHADLRKCAPLGWASPDAKRAITTVASRISNELVWVQPEDALYAQASALIAAGRLMDAAKVLADKGRPGLETEARRCREVHLVLQTKGVDAAIARAHLRGAVQTEDAWEAFVSNVSALSGRDASERRGPTQKPWPWRLLSVSLALAATLTASIGWWLGSRADQLDESTTVADAFVEGVRSDLESTPTATDGVTSDPRLSERSTRPSLDQPAPDEPAPDEPAPDEPAPEPVPPTRTSGTRGTVAVAPVQPLQPDSSTISPVLESAKPAYRRETIPFKDHVEFRPGSDDLDANAISLLHNVADVLKANPDLNLTVAGHSDGSTFDSPPMELSTKRANAVRTHLVELGVDPKRLEAQGYGDRRPLGGTAAVNRRVEFEGWRVH